VDVRAGSPKGSASCEDDCHSAAYWALRPFDAGFGPVYLLLVQPGGVLYMRPERAFADPRGVLGLVAKHQIQNLGATNSFFAKVIEVLDREPFDADLSCLRSVRFSGETTSPQVAAGVHERLKGLGAVDFEVRFNYASSEAGHISMISDKELGEGPAGSAVSGPVSQGPARPGTELRVVDEDGSVVRHGEVGRIETRSDSQMFSGYYGDPEATREAFTTDGWFRTGDLGFVDRVGVTIVGRVSGMIIANGRNISLAQIEAHLHGVPPHGANRVPTPCDLDGVRSGRADG